MASVVAGVVVILSAAAGTASLSHASGGCAAGRQPSDSRTFRSYSFQVFNDADTAEPNGCLEVRHEDRLVHGMRAAAGSITFEDIPAGKDIDRDGVSDLVVRTAQPGRCCPRLTVLALGDQVRVVAQIDLGRFEDARFADLNGDGRLELLTRDDAFVCWRPGCACSVAPRIVLSYWKGDLYLATALMRNRTFSQDDRARLLASIRGASGCDDAGKLPADALEQVLELVYAGKARSAWSLFDAAWPAGEPGKQEFLRELRGQLRRSRYFNEILELNGGRLW